jgi:hydroxymethylglutaryl-CoA synthase
MSTDLHLSPEHFARVQSRENSRFPESVGIVATDIYFPKTFVSQTKLEEFSNVETGKFTIGLGQEDLAFVSDREDIYSMCLTVVSSLMAKYNIRYEDIGRLEVSTETIIDHSKSVKSVLMKLFEESGNSDVEGVDTVHACYAGTNALFNSVAWIESSAWDGRYALVVAGDIAEYASGPARPTGGAGAVAMLIGPGAPIVLERGMRASHMEHAYDFYKPRLDSPYPVVDGQFSNICYLRSLDICFQRLKAKSMRLAGEAITTESFDHVVFHSPYNKLVQKSFSRLYYNDFLEHPENPLFQHVQQYKDVSLEESYDSRTLTKAFADLTKKQYAAKVGPSTVIPKHLGNMYSASLYASLVSLVSQTGEQLAGKRVLMFSYGSGLAASIFVLKVRSDTGARLAQIQSALNITSRLASRIECTPDVFADTMLHREHLHKVDSFNPKGDLTQLFTGAYYLTNKDDMCRRFYLQA